MEHLSVPMGEAMEARGARILPYPMNRNECSTTSNDNLHSEKTLKSKPMFPTTLTVKAILKDDYELVKNILVDWKRSGKEWDDYIHKTGPVTRKILTDKFRECRQNGFFSFNVEGDEIVYKMLVYPRLHGSRVADYSKIDGHWRPE